MLCLLAFVLLSVWDHVVGQMILHPPRPPDIMDTWPGWVEDRETVQFLRRDVGSIAVGLGFSVLFRVLPAWYCLRLAGRHFDRIATD
jgi:hypothetical protein